MPTDKKTRAGRRNDPRREERREDWRHLATVVTLLGGVLGTLVLGAALRVDPDAAERDLTLIEARSSERTPETATRAVVEEDRGLSSDDESATPSHPSADPTELAQRARDDARRLSAPGDTWTLQFMVTRRADTARRVLDQIGNDPNLHLLPMLLDDEPCFRICWGQFDSRESAVSFRDIPAVLASLNQEPIPRPIAELIP